ncbi:MAG TPA: PfkB family carbohydrate kinase [Pseudonocardia sp.]
MRILVVGDVALDVLVTPAAAPVQGADVPARIRTRPGGAGANTAAWLAHLGADATLAARVGDDHAGRAAAADLAAAGVATHLAVDPDAATCTVVALLGSADRTLLSDRGAAAHLAPADLPGVAGFDHLHVSGYVLLSASSRPAGLAALAAARGGGLTTSVDPQVAPALAAPGRAAAFLDDVHGVDLLLPNADELRALGGEAAVLRRVGAVVTSAGADGASWADGSGRWSVPACPTDVADATGAGDAFDAGVLVSWLNGADREAALTAGCAAGAAAVGRIGARP